LVGEISSLVVMRRDDERDRSGFRGDFIERETKAELS
jgi:hypothetical protein